MSANSRRTDVLVLPQSPKRKWRNQNLEATIKSDRRRHSLQCFSRRPRTHRCGLYRNRAHRARPWQPRAYLGEGDTRPLLYRLCMYDKAEADGFQETAKRLFAFVPLDVMESQEWFTLSINARRILEHLLIVNIGLCSDTTASCACQNAISQGRASAGASSPMPSGNSSPPDCSP